MISDLLKERRLSKLPIYSPYDAGTLAFRFRIGPEPDDMYALTSAADALSACSYSAGSPLGEEGDRLAVTSGEGQHAGCLKRAG